MQIMKHHIKYKEIHGIDEVILMTRSEHSKLHNRLRKEGKCNISPDDLQKISCSASQRKPQILHKNGLFNTMIEQIQNRTVNGRDTIRIYCTKNDCPMHQKGWIYSGAKRYPGVVICPYCKKQIRIPMIKGED